MIPSSYYYLTWTLLLRVFNAAGQIAITIFLLKAYDKTAVGLFAVFVSNTMLVSLLLRQGLDRTLILVGVKNNLSKQAGNLYSLYFKRVLLLSPIFGLINICAFYATSGPLENLSMTCIVFFIPTIFSCSFLSAGYFGGVGKTVSATIQQPGFSAGITSVVLIFSHLLNSPQNVYWTYFFTATAVSVYGFIRVTTLNSTGFRSICAQKFLIKPLLRSVLSAYSKRYLVINFFTTFSSVYFTTFLALFVLDETIGEFRVVERLAMIIAFNLSFINVIFPSKTIKKLTANDCLGFGKAVKHTFTFQYVTGGALFVALIICKPVLTQWLEISNDALYYLLISAQLINSLTGPVRVLLMYAGGQKILQISAVAETIGSMSLYWIMYSYGGVTGLALAYFVSISTPNIVLAYIVYKRFGIIPLPVKQNGPNPHV